MFIYELLTLHQPFEGHESVKECILEGGRPPLTYRVSRITIASMYRGVFAFSYLTCVKEGSIPQTGREGRREEGSN